MKTTKFFNNVERKWVVVDAKDKILGRLAVQVAKILQGKNKAVYTPNFLCGDKVIVINAKHIQFSANKAESKIYDKYTGYHNGRKEMHLKVLMEKNPSRVISLAVKGMLPRSNLGARMLKSLKVYSEGEHQQTAQKPQSVTI